MPPDGRPAASGIGGRWSSELRSRWSGGPGVRVERARDELVAFVHFDVLNVLVRFERDPHGLAVDALADHSEDDVHALSPSVEGAERREVADVDQGLGRVHAAVELGPLTQRDFLVRLGIEARAGRLKASASPGQMADVDSALTRLIGAGRNEMGALFKVLALSHPQLPTLPAFES